MSLLASEYGKRIQEPHTAPDMSHLWHMEAPAAYRVDFYLIYVAIGVPGFKMSWTARSQTPGGSVPAGVASPATGAMNGGGPAGAHTTPTADDDRYSGSDLRLVRELSTALTSSTATRAIQWGPMTSNVTTSRLMISAGGP